MNDVTPIRSDLSRFSRGTVCLFCFSARAQVASGTVIVFQITNSEFVIAADSRALFSNKAPDDTQCKIAALSSQFVVGIDGACFGMRQSPKRTKT
jgi:hypothetical protein